MIRYGTTIFISAFLLFQIQPMIAREILPAFGGTAAVWTTCMMFFQVVLLLGYLYSHLLRQSLSPQKSWLVHGVVMLLAACSLVLGISWWETDAATSPPPVEIQLADSQSGELVATGQEPARLAGAIVRVLALSIGLPFFVLSTTGPLVQAWQATSHAQQSPYRLYALSNAASVMALISYPFLIERWVSLDHQLTGWTIGFLMFCLTCYWAGRQVGRQREWGAEQPGEMETEESRLPASSNTFALSWKWRVPVWVLLPMTASIALLATTNLMCQEVASIPFLWILPLTLYLLSFIICFEQPRLYRRRPWVLLLGASAVIAVLLVHLDVNAGLALQVLGLSAVCFFSSMVCHGELERSKPSHQHLTAFYLWIAVGGAMGGIFVALVAPEIFVGFYEFHLGLLVSLAVAAWGLYLVWQREPDSSQKMSLFARGSALDRGLTLISGSVVLTGMAATLCSLIYFLDPSYHEGLVFRGRNEYGLTTIIDRDGYRQFINGRVVHGGQCLLPEQELQPSGYYTAGSGVAVAFSAQRQRQSNPGVNNGGLQVGVLGLGAGAMCTWLEPDDSIVFYEINPMVVEVAQKYFTYLDRAPGNKSIIVGDGRVRMQQQLANQNVLPFDILFMDAFASDSIPVHLLTEECFEIYLKHLKEDGVLVIHISNHFIDLLPVVLSHANTFDLAPLYIDVPETAEDGGTRWVLLTRNSSLAQLPVVQDAVCSLPANVQPVRWTDDFSSVAAQLKWSATVDWAAAIETDTSQEKPDAGPNP